MACWCAEASSRVSNHTPAMRSPDSHLSSWGCRPMTAPHWAPTRSAMVTPTVQFSRQAMPTIWSVVWMALGRRTRGTASMSATVSNSFMPMGVVRSRSTACSRASSSSQSIEAVRTCAAVSFVASARSVCVTAAPSAMAGLSSRGACLPMHSPAALEGRRYCGQRSRDGSLPRRPTVCSGVIPSPICVGRRTCLNRRGALP